MTRVLIALSFAGLLAACGVDGEPSAPVSKSDVSFATLGQPIAPGS